MADNINSEPEEGFDPEELKNLDNNFGDDDLIIEDFDDDELGSGDEGECTCPDCLAEEAGSVERFISSLPIDSDLGFTKEESAALVRACFSQLASEESPEIGPTL